MKNVFLFFIITATILPIVHSQDFGFGFDEGETAAPPPPFTISFKGEVGYEFTPFFENFDNETQMLPEEIYNIASLNYKFDYAFTSKYIDVYIVLNANPYSISELWALDPVLKEKNYTARVIDEVFIKNYLGPVNVEIGYRKLNWGKADSGGPLDVTNPIDYSDLRNITDLRARKIARPMIHLTWNMGSFSKIEGVYIPNFYGHRFASEGRWVPWQVVNMPNVAGEGIMSSAAQYFSYLPSPYYEATMAGLSSGIAAYAPYISPEFPDTSGLEHFQAGLRFTTTVGSADIGAQYYYGTLFRPNLTINGIDDFLNDLNYNLFVLNNLAYKGDPSLLSPQMKYNRYHQIGLDYAQVVLGFNIRAEAAIHLTEDTKGDMGSVRNPFIGWSFGFDRNLFWGLNLNIQCNQTFRLFNNKVGDNPVLDAEAGTKPHSTRLTAQLSKEQREEVENKIIFIWDIEDNGFHLIPYRSWVFKNMTYIISMGFFFGNRDSELGYYKKSSFLKIGLKYSF
jgi:hypothetical protein